MNTEQLLGKVETRLFIGGQWVDGSQGETYEVHNPATGELLAAMASGTKEDAVRALDAAVDARRDWERTAPRIRS